MAKKATGKTGSGSKAKGAAKRTSRSRALVARRSESSGRRSNDSAGDAFIKLLQSPFVAELVAVAATAALAALAEHGFTSGGDGSRGKRAGKAVKEAGKAAAAAVGRRLGNEMEEIRKAANTPKGGAKA
jgi:hypothetical protein